MVLYFIFQLLLSLCLIILFLLVFTGIELFQIGLVPTLVISIFFTYFLALFLLASINKLSRILMKTKEGEIEGIGLIFWTIQTGTFEIARNLTQKLTIHSPMPDFILKLFGFKHNKGVSILTSRTWDLDLIKIGINTLVGTNTIVSGHHIRQGKMYRKRIKIGKNVTIGGDSVIAPGVTIGDNTIVAINSTVPPNWELDANSLYGGVPVKKLKSLASPDPEE